MVYFLKAKFGYSIRPNNIKEIIKKISLIKSNYLEMSKKACKNSAIFNWDDIVNEFKKLY